MRVSFPSLIVALLVLSCGALASAQSSASNIFTTNLSLGARGTQVVALQKILNRDLDTHVASTGPGSPGYETDYFGLLTKAAVVRFQEKYANEVLAPAGLTQGSGYFGFYTRTKLNALSSLATNTSPLLSPSTSSSSTTTTGSGQTTAPQNPNLKNIDKFMAALDTIATKQKLSSATLVAIKQQVMEEVATTTDLRAAFWKTVPNANQAIGNDSFTGRVLAIIGQAFSGVFAPEHARAATGVPFGGALLVTLYCTQSQTWLLTLEPLPPSYAVLLTYTPFTQAFASYNIPFTSWLLGEYEPGAGVCVMGACPYCYTIPSEGMISPMTGSSPT